MTNFKRPSQPTWFYIVAGECHYVFYLPLDRKDRWWQQGYNMKSLWDTRARNWEDETGWITRTADKVQKISKEKALMIVHLWGYDDKLDPS